MIGKFKRPCSPPIWTKRTITSKQQLSTIQPISTKRTTISKQWWSTIPPM